MLANKYIIALAGPTAVGKTGVSIQLAKHLRCDVISCDSRQFYKGLDIGTAKVTSNEMDGIRHHFIDHIEITKNYSVGQYEKDVLEFLNTYFKTNDSIILTGGSGLFFNAILEGLDHFPDVPQSLIEHFNTKYEQEGIVSLQEDLKKLDPEYYNEVDINNHRRLIRALSVIEASGQKFSAFRQKKKENRPFKSIRICLQMDRDLLYKRINNRVDKMMEKGLLNEAKSFFNLKHLNSLQTVGYSELFKYFEGEITEKEAVELIKRNTRRYAKRQSTWFKNQGEWQMFSPDQLDEIMNFVDSRKVE